MSVKDFILPGTSILTNLMDNIFNTISTNKTNQINKEINNKMLDYNTKMTQAQWERDDNAHQREVADLQSAGLSPLASLSGAGVTGALSAPNPISMQAPQINSNNLINSLLENEKIKEEKRHNNQLEAQRWQELKNDADEIKIKADNLELGNKELQNTIKHQAELMKLQADELAEQIRTNTENETLRKKELKEKEAEYQSQRFLEEVRHITGGTDVPYTEYTDYNKYVIAVRYRLLKYEQFIDSLGATSSSSATGQNKSSSNSTNFGFNTGAEFAGTGMNVGANGGQTISESNGSYMSESKNLSEEQKQKYNKFMQENPIPVFVSHDENGYKHAKSYNITLR